MTERHRMTDARIAALVVTAICSVSTLIGFVTPNWLASDRRLYGANFVKLGLWETCFRSYHNPDDYDLTKYYSGCRWIFADEYYTIRHLLMPSFFIATQVLYTIGFIFLLVACIGVLAIQLCFVIDREIFAMKVLSITMFLAALFTTIAVLIFGIRGDDRDWMPDHDHNFLSWSYGLAVVGVFFEWMSAILFWAESRILYKKELKREQQMFNMEPTNIKA
ncbi:uncharacterized protein LOC128959138 isoform X2 [Oppia nitens]|uniref:uncharacterized protein LOC128959138 isoform X2 n=1 Tax=Oppia nitens TaxID=1686743 RepID=UPI0023DB2B11|nr:uncharacterized protein LOC128959138 isoform X2 [Oppia nitens]